MEKISITIEKEQLEWLEDKVTAGKFASVSHGMRVAVQELMRGETQT